MFKLMRSMDNPAITQFFSYSLAGSNGDINGNSDGNGKGQRLYLLKPYSGKTHQLRVALSSIGAPIIGDTLYYTNLNNNSNAKAIPVADRGYLHAYALRFEFLDTLYEFVLPPNDGDFYLSPAMKSLLLELKKPWQINWPRL